MRHSPYPAQLGCTTLFADTMRHDNDRTSDRRVTVLEASSLLGITPDAVRARLRRGTLRKERAEDGTLLVVLDQGTSDTTATDSDTTATEQPTDLYIKALKSQIDMLQHELEDRKQEAQRKDAILLSMTEAMKVLEAPQGSISTREARDGDLRGSEEQGKGDVPPEKERRSW